jgi:pimeloyl-ACP methyl ester carboxylesterase
MKALPPPRPPIVLLHGLAGWSRGLLPLERALRRAFCCEVIRLRLGLGFDCIAGAAGRAARTIQRIADEHEVTELDVVGHSLGGLIAAHVLKRDLRDRVRTALALGSPFRGTPFARAGLRVFGRLGPSLSQMVPGCRFLAELEREPAPEGATLVSVAGLDDLVVPAPCARLPRRRGHRNVVVPDVDHWGLIADPRALRAIERLLRRPAPAQMGRAPAVRLAEPMARWRMDDDRDRLRAVQRGA